ncbi:hypothetical protein [Spongiimicrobium salis]|uniref:hypothetical protein n=1 Tax=Spongiimicrobium salis TaxID=1667022 RepID=UPI00374D931A
MFLMDALGALATTLMLSGVFPLLESYIGMPSKILYLLAAIACCLFLYSLGCHLFIKSNWRPFLIGIACSNLIYLIISITVIAIHHEKIQALGFLYFILEFTIIGGIIFLEYQCYQHQK